MNPGTFTRFVITLVAGLLAAGTALALQNCPVGYPRSTPDADFADAGNGTVRHVPTGLVWKRCAEGQTWDGTTCTGSAARYNWAHAMMRVDAVNSGADGTQNAGANDWRLPNIKELHSIYELGCYDPEVNLNQFPATPSWIFWSSSPLVGPAADFNVRTLNFGPPTITTGDINDSYYVAQPGALNVRLVRGGLANANFETVPPVVQPADGLWSINIEINGDNGRGFQVETRNGTTVFTYYGYIAGGHDHWYLAAGPLINGNVSADMTQYRGGTVLGNPYKPASADGSAGSVTLSFLSATTGTITLPGEPGKLISKFEFNGGASPAIVPSNGLWVIDAEVNGQDGRGFQIEQHGSMLVFT